MKYIKMLLKKRGYFFILDAVLGLSIILIGVILIMSSYVNVHPPSQVGLLANDLTNFLSTKKINDLNNPYAGIGGELWNNGTITDADNSLLQQIGDFYAANKLDVAEKFIQSVSEGTIPPEFLYEVWIDGVILYPLVPPAEHIKSKDNTDLLLTSKVITFGVVNKTTSNLWGPYKVEVFLWEK